MADGRVVGAINSGRRLGKVLDGRNYSETMADRWTDVTTGRIDTSDPPKKTTRVSPERIRGSDRTPYY